MSVSISEGAKLDFDAIASGRPAFTQRMLELATKISEARELRAAAEKMMAEADRQNRIEAERLRSAQEEAEKAKTRYENIYREIMTIAGET